jgi:hypothetical protein
MIKSKNNPVFFDEFEIDSQFQELKKKVNKMEQDIYKFISPTKNKQAAKRARKSLGEIRKIASELRKSISKQNAHNNSEY